MIRIAAANVNTNVLGVDVRMARAGSSSCPEGVAGVLSVSISGQIPGLASAGGTVLLRINTTGKKVDQTISVGNQNIAVKFTDGTIGTADEKHFVGFAILNATIEFPPFFKLSGDFTFQSSGNETKYGARNVEIFLGYVPGDGELRDDNGDVKDDAIGLLVTNATVGVVKFRYRHRDPTDDDGFAIFAHGTAALIGLDFLTISGTITVRINNTGRAIDELIELPTDPAGAPPGSDGIDNNGNGIIDEAGETPPFASSSPPLPRSRSFRPALTSRATSPTTRPWSSVSATS